MSTEKSRKRHKMRVEDSEAKVFDREFARLLERFNKFLFFDGKGSFESFDNDYREIASKEYVHIKPDPNWFTKFALI